MAASGSGHTATTGDFARLDRANDPYQTGYQDAQGALVTDAEQLARVQAQGPIYAQAGYYDEWGDFVEPPRVIGPETVNGRSMTPAEMEEFDKLHPEVAAELAQSQINLQKDATPTLPTVTVRPDPLTPDEFRLEEIIQRNNTEIPPSSFERIASDASALMNRYLGYMERTPWAAEVAGPQSIPGTVHGAVESALAAARGGWQSSTRANVSRYVGPVRYGTQPIIVVNNAAPPGVPRVMAVPAAPAPSLFSTVGSGARSAASVAPILSVAGTALEYGMYAFAGRSEASNKAGWTDFGVDATLDLQKGIAAGAAGAATGAFAGSVVPVLGTVGGTIVGFGAGFAYALAIENAYSSSGSREFFKGWASGK